MTNPRHHDGGLDSAVACHGGALADWLDLSTGINPVSYPIGDLTDETWSALPDACAVERFEAAARIFWDVPEEAGIVAAPGALRPCAAFFAGINAANRYDYHVAHGEPEPSRR